MGWIFFHRIHLIRHGGSLRWTRLRRVALTKLDLDAGHVFVGLEIRTKTLLYQTWHGPHLRSRGGLD